jgi:N6-L-threonylcarbamoyladenine synthase
MKAKYVLGIETSCDDTSVAILEKRDGNPCVLAHEKFSQELLLKKWGGVVPEIAARNHLQKISPLIQHCLQKAQLDSAQIDLIGVTTIPGLLGPLLTGLNAAKTYSLLHETSIYPVNHLYAHLEAIHIDQTVSYPYLGLLVSGGHTIFFWVESSNDFHVLGSTIDDAAGEAFDKGGKMLGLGYPAGHLIDKISQEGDSARYPFSVAMRSSSDARMSFSGLKTALRNLIEKEPALLNQDSQEFKDLCASYQEAICETLLFKSKYALRLIKEKFNYNKPVEIVIGGGVACNSRLRNVFKEKYKSVHIVTPQYCTDNGAMVANYALRNSDASYAFPDCLQLDARGRYIDKKEFLNG